MFCPNCGQTIPDNENICPGCGQDVLKYIPPAEVLAAASMGPSAASGPSPSPAAPEGGSATAPRRPAAPPPSQEELESAPAKPAAPPEPAKKTRPASPGQPRPAGRMRSMLQSVTTPKPKPTEAETPTEPAARPTEPAAQQPQQTQPITPPGAPPTQEQLESGAVPPAAPSEDGAPAAPTGEPSAPEKAPGPLAMLLAQNRKLVLGAACAVLAVIVCLVVGITALGRLYRPNAAAVKIAGENGAKLTELTNEQFGYYYWGEYYYYVQANGFAFDATKPLADQTYSDDQTWQDYFVELACESLKQTEVLKAEAEAEGFTLPADYQSEYDSTIDSLAEYAASAGFIDEAGNGDVAAYVRDSYGKDATVEHFEQYLYDSYLVTAYSDQLYDGVSFSDAELEAYYNENRERLNAYGIYKSETNDVNVRHILIQPEELGEDATEEELAAAKDAARDQAQSIYNQWYENGATEEAFAALAEEYSQDPGSSSNGGLYEGVYYGQMVTPFNNWCFDQDLQPGDTGIVETDFGYHVMYFVGYADSAYWKTAAGQEYHYQKYTDALQALLDKYTLTTTRRLKVQTPDAVIEIQEKAQEDSVEENPSAVG